MALGALVLEEEEPPLGRPLKITPERLSMAHRQTCSSRFPGDESLIVSNNDEQGSL
jgi:hypothetical protein